jgi:hypothetical protein
MEQRPAKLSGTGREHTAVSSVEESHPSLIPSPFLSVGGAPAEVEYERGRPSQRTHGSTSTSQLFRDSRPSEERRDVLATEEESIDVAKGQRLRDALALVASLELPSTLSSETTHGIRGWQQIALCFLSTVTKEMEGKRKERS